MKTEFWLFGVGDDVLELWETVNGKPMRVDMSRNANPFFAKGQFAARAVAKTMVRISRQVEGSITVYLYPPIMLKETYPRYYRRLTPREESQTRGFLQAENQRQYAQHWT
jgi:hypothetical protein